MEMKKIYLIVACISAISIGIGLVSGIKGVLGNSIILSAVLVIFTYFFVRYEKYRRIREMEEKFPQFLRDLSELSRAGISLAQAIRQA